MKTPKLNIVWYNEHGVRDSYFSGVHFCSFYEAINRGFDFLNKANLIDPYMFKYIEPILEDDNEEDNV